MHQNTQKDEPLKPRFIAARPVILGNGQLGIEAIKPVINNGAQKGEKFYYFEKPDVVVADWGSGSAQAKALIEMWRTANANPEITPHLYDGNLQSLFQEKAVRGPQYRVPDNDNAASPQHAHAERLTL